MVLLLNVDGDEGSLAFYKDIDVDTSPAHVLNVASSKRNGKFPNASKHRLPTTKALLEAATPLIFERVCVDNLSLFAEPLASGVRTYGRRQR